MDVLGEAGLALRRLAKAPGYTAAAVLSLSLAIGVNSAIFSAWRFAALGSRWLASLLFEVEPLDPGTYAAAVAVVITATAGPSVLPAHRATRLDPMTLLREE